MPSVSVSSDELRRQLTIQNHIVAVQAAWRPMER